MSSHLEDRSHVAGLDLGGTDIKYGALSLEGQSLSNLTELRKIASQVKNGPEQTLERFAEALSVLSRQFGDQLAIGLATAGPATLDGRILTSTNYGDSWNDCPIRQMVEERFNLLTVYENDANAAAISEHRALISLDQNYATQPGILLTVGTGLGGGIINGQGKLERGFNGEAAELGHIAIRGAESSVDLEAREIACGCYEVGCAEQYTTLSFIERELIEYLKEAPSHPLKSYMDENGAREAAKKVLSYAGDGDALCEDIILSQARNLGRSIREMTRSIDPGWITIGGGVTEATLDLRTKYLNEVKKMLNTGSRKGFTDNRRVDYALLGDNAGWMGAALSALEQHATRDKS